MTQFDATNDDTGYEEDVDQPDPNDPAQLRKKLKNALRSNKELLAQQDEVNQVRKENAFLKAGLPDTPQVKFFQEHYSGEPTPEAIKTAASEFGFAPVVDQEIQDEVAVISAQSDAVPGADMPADDREKMMKEFADVVAQGGNGEDVLRRYGHPVASDNR